MINRNTKVSSYQEFQLVLEETTLLGETQLTENIASGIWIDQKEKSDGKLTHFTECAIQTRVS